MITAVYFGAGLWLNYLVAGQPSSLTRSLLVSATQFWPWSIAAPLAAWLARQWPIAWPPKVSAVLVHVVAGVTTATVTASMEQASRRWAFGVTPTLLPSNVAFDFLVYWAVVIGASFIGFYRLSQERAVAASKTEALLHQARLQLLHAQLQPHFLFNALNTIAETLHEDAHKADAMVAHLCDLLRATLGDVDPTTTLGEELVLAGHYIAIQQARFGERLVTSVDVPRSLLSHRVPRLLLQPLLENAVHHGIAPRRSGGRIWIAAQRHQSALAIDVGDDGVGCDRESTPGAGIGLSNTRSRLAAMFGSQADVVVRSDAQGTVVTVTLPDGEP